MMNISINEIYLEEIKSYQKWYGGNENIFYYNFNIGLVIGFIIYLFVVSLFFNEINCIFFINNLFIFCNIYIYFKTSDILLNKIWLWKNFFKIKIKYIPKRYYGLRYSENIVLDKNFQKHPFIDIIYKDNVSNNYIYYVNGITTTSQSFSEKISEVNELHKTKEVYFFGKNEVVKIMKTKKDVDDLKYLLSGTTLKKNLSEKIMQNIKLFTVIENNNKDKLKNKYGLTDLDNISKNAITNTDYDILFKEMKKNIEENKKID